MTSSLLSSSNAALHPGSSNVTIVKENDTTDDTVITDAATPSANQVKPIIKITSNYNPNSKKESRSRKPSSRKPSRKRPSNAAPKGDVVQLRRDKKKKWSTSKSKKAA